MKCGKPALKLFTKTFVNNKKKLCNNKISFSFMFPYVFRCSGCDTLFPSLMLLEHHKEEYEHWSESEEDRHQHCCRRNRRNDYDYTDTETGTSDAESEDLERLL